MLLRVNDGEERAGNFATKKKRAGTVQVLSLAISSGVDLDKLFNLSEIQDSSFMR